MKRILTALLASLYTFITPAQAYEPNAWQKKAIEMALKEQRVKHAYWSQDISLQIMADDDGTNRTGYAEYICLLLNEADRPDGEFVAVTIWDALSATTDSPKKLGKAACQ